MASFTGTERFELLRKLGQGGMGAVYAVFDARRQRRVALKALSDPEGGSLYRFKREFRAVADTPHLADLAVDRRPRNRADLRGSVALFVP